MKKVDLHCHSTASDGSLTPTQLVERAKNLGLNVLALTDHDTVAGLNELENAGQKYNLKVVPGVELSVNHEDGTMHLLGYGVDYSNENMIATINKIRNSRETRNGKILAILNDLGYQITLEQIKEISKDGTVGRGHIGLALVKAGYFGSVDETFKGLLDRDGKAYVSRFRLELREAIDLVHEAGGVTVWAHPGLYGEQRRLLIENRLTSWIEYGLDGIESDYSQHTVDLRDELRQITRDYNIIFTGGSDFHGDLKPQIELGMGPENHDIPLICYENLISALGS